MAQRRPSVPRTRGLPGGAERGGSGSVSAKESRQQQQTGHEYIISAEKEVTETGEHQIIRANFGAKLTKPAKQAAPPKPTKQAEPPKPTPPAPPPEAKKPPAKSNKSEERARARTQLSSAIRKGREKPGSSTTAAQSAPEPVPAKRFSGRLLALAVVLITIIVMLAPSVRVYIQQSSEIATLESEIAVQKERQQEIESQVARWEDPSFIKAQARERLFLVMPGEKRYLVKGVDGFKESENEVAGAAPADLAWVDALWDSVQRSATAK
ncbi:FtsB family cell division protein [Arthrobacter roseus]|uniref:FtsB family cell division protein n=1 Tax=Arthrobacter roseus TaxID=136274 RepID=UPI001962C24E|nr:septum formation initiator family protein [Arthrobacter roseus]MBM7847967.1 cell division protein FtsB [Arthrobacter roseus]